MDSLKNKTPDRDKKINNHVREKIVIFTLALIVAGLLFYFFKDVFIPFIKLETARDLDGAKEFLTQKGAIGGVTVSLIEALQMVVIFIPAEFIQLSSGMSYPWWLAVILCDAGVILGSSIIFFFVRVFKFQGDIFNKTAKINKYDKSRKKSEKSLMILMYFLFFMPVIPFGAICYYASNKKISYPKYLFTCATGVIPSIVTSIVMGTAVKEFIANALPVWLLALIIVLAAAVLFLCIYFILKKFYFKEFDKTPDSPVYSIIMKLTRLYLFGKCRIRVDKNLLTEIAEIKGSFLLLANHGTAFDFYFASRVAPEKRFAIVMNRHIFNNKLIKKGATKAGVIPKKLFSPDVDTIKRIMRASAQGYPILMMPEGRMSSVGVSYPINPAVTKLAKKLNIPVVLVKVRHGFFVKPKWRKNYMRNTVNVSAVNIIGKEQIAELSGDRLYEMISDGLYTDDFEETPPLFRRGGKAKGLENVLYACPRCGALYSTRSKNNVLFCTACHAEYEIDERYSFKSGEFKNMRDYYFALEKLEKKKADNLELSFDVTMKIFHKDDNGYETDAGRFTLTREKISFISGADGEDFEINNCDLESIAYSAGEEFEFYRNDRLYYFYPVTERKLCARVALIFDMIKKERKKENEND